MNILITGGAGYLGGAITDILKDTSHKITVYDNLLYEEVYRKKVSFVYGDVRDTYKLKDCLSWADVVIWTAALVGDQACAIDKPLAKEINADSLQFLVTNFNKKIIFTSTCSVYGLAEGILTEESTLNPQSHYAQTKIEAEKILQNSNSLIFRLGTLFGVSDEFSRLRTDLVVNTLTMHAHADKKLTVFGGKQYRPVIHVRDVAKIICDNIISNNQGIYNLHYTNITILELAELIKKVFLDIKIEVTETSFEDTRNYQVSSAKAKINLNFNPTITLVEGINELKFLLDSKRIKNPYLNRYSNYNYLKDIL